MARTLQAVLLWGAALTALVVGVATAVTQAKWVYVPAVALGVCGTIIVIYRDWETSSYRREVAQFLSAHRGVVLLEFFGSLGMQALFIYALSAFWLQAGEHPCVCFGDERGRDWFDLTIGAGVGTFVEVAALFLSILSLYALVRTRDVQ